MSDIVATLVPLYFNRFSYSPFLHYRLVSSLQKLILEIQVTKLPDLEVRVVNGYLNFKY